MTTAELDLLDFDDSLDELSLASQSPCWGKHFARLLLADLKVAQSLLKRFNGKGLKPADEPLVKQLQEAGLKGAQLLASIKALAPMTWFMRGTATGNSFRELSENVAARIRELQR